MFLLIQLIDISVSCIILLVDVNMEICPLISSIIAISSQIVQHKQDMLLIVNDR